MRLGRALLLTALVALASGCYRQVVNTGKAPSTTTINKAWTATWAWGLVPAQAIDVTQQCAGGIATVTTQLTVPNWFAQAITFGIYSPRSVTVTCAQGTAMRNTPTVRVGEDAADVLSALANAADLSRLTGQSVTVRF